jgi:hypothetical protein
MEEGADPRSAGDRNATASSRIQDSGQYWTWISLPLGEVTGMIVAAATKLKTLAPYSRAGITITKAPA